MRTVADDEVIELRMQQSPPIKREAFANWAPTALGSTIRHVGISLANGISSLTADSSEKEKISLVKFGQLEYVPSNVSGAGASVHRTVLLLGYTSGFQVWDLEQGAPALLVSRREGPVRWAAGAACDLPTWLCMQRPRLSCASGASEGCWCVRGMLVNAALIRLAVDCPVSQPPGMPSMSGCPMARLCVWSQFTP